MEIISPECHSPWSCHNGSTECLLMQPRNRGGTFYPIVGEIHIIFELWPSHIATKAKYSKGFPSTMLVSFTPGTKCAGRLVIGIKGKGNNNARIVVQLHQINDSANHIKAQGRHLGIQLVWPLTLLKNCPWRENKFIFFSTYSLLYRANSRTIYLLVYFHVNWIIALLKAKQLQFSPSDSAERRIRPSSLTAAVLPVKLAIIEHQWVGLTWSYHFSFVIKASRYLLLKEEKPVVFLISSFLPVQFTVHWLKENLLSFKARGRDLSQVAHSGFIPVGSPNSTAKSSVATAIRLLAVMTA